MVLKCFQSIDKISSINLKKIYDYKIIIKYYVGRVGPVDIDALVTYVERMSPVIKGADGRVTILY